MENSPAQTTPSSFIKTLSTIHLALMAGPFLFGAFAYFQTENSYLDYTNTEDVFMLVVPIFALSGVFMGNLLFKKIVKSSDQVKGLRSKLTRFQTASLIKYMIIEGPALIGIVAFYQTANLTYLYISGVLILFLYLLRPTKYKIEQGLRLKGEEKSQFNRLNQPIP